MEKNAEESRDKLSIGLSVFIALCVISLFCAISIAIAKNIDNMAQNQQTHYFPLPNDSNQEATKFIY